MNSQHNWKQLLKDLKYDYLERTAPGFFAASGGRTMKVSPYSDQTSNGLTKCIVDFLKHSGHYANRINTMGVARKEKVQLAFGNVRELVRFTHSSTNKGTADIDSIIHGKPVKIEVKVGRDKQSDHQIKEEQRITSAGGIYYIAKDFPSFLQWFRETFETVPAA